jgi:hypothetical protein
MGAGEIATGVPEFTTQGETPITRLAPLVARAASGILCLMKTHVLPLLAGAALTTGCVSYVNDFTQPMKIETRAADGTLVAGADCQLQNDKASQTIKSGDTVGVRRSSEPLQIRCRHASHADAVAQALPRINTGMIGNVLFGSGTAGLIGRSGGTAYTYPAWVQLVFGQTLVFDRRDEKDGQATPGRPPGAGG